MPKDAMVMRRLRATIEGSRASSRDGSEADDDLPLTIAATTSNGIACRLLEFLGRHFSESRPLAWVATCSPGDAFPAA